VLAADDNRVHVGGKKMNDNNRSVKMTNLWQRLLALWWKLNDDDREFVVLTGEQLLEQHANNNDDEKKREAAWYDNQR